MRDVRDVDLDIPLRDVALDIPDRAVLRELKVPLDPVVLPVWGRTFSNRRRETFFMLCLLKAESEMASCVENGVPRALSFSRYSSLFAGRYLPSGLDLMAATVRSSCSTMRSHF